MKFVSLFLAAVVVSFCLSSCASGDEAHYTPTQEAAQHADFVPTAN